MRAVERLKRDHQILRSKLDVLESALRMGPETWFVLREVCFTLSRQLHDHIKREEELVGACRRALNPKILAEVVIEHKDEPQQWHRINRLFISEAHQSLERIRPALTDVIRKLRHHMAEEETELFPLLESACPETEKAVGPQPGVTLEETMTVNRIVQEFPGTRPVFERLFINVPLEGCTCLDEVAWRHGMESRDLLQTLERAIGLCECRGQALHEEDGAREPEQIGVSH